LTNTGTATLNISSIAASGRFAVTSGANACGSSVVAGSNCLIYVTFAPTAAGAQSGTLSITDNAAGSPQSVALSGTGMDFSLADSPTSRSVRSTDTTTYTLTVSPLNGFTGTVGLSCSGIPATVSCTLSPASVILGSTQSSVVTIKTGVGAATPKG